MFPADISRRTEQSKSGGKLTYMDYGGLEVLPRYISYYRTSSFWKRDDRAAKRAKT
jgi:hypothetical protein